MRRILRIARRDYVAVVRTKAFVIGLVAFPLLFGGGSMLPLLLRTRGGPPQKRIAIIDRTGVAATAVTQAARAANQAALFDKTTGLQVNQRYDFEAVAADNSHPDEQRLELCDRLRRGELLAFVEIGPDAVHPRIDPPPAISFYTNAPAAGSVRGWLANAINDGLRRVRLAEAGVAQARFNEVLAVAPLETMNLVTRDPRTGFIAAPRKENEIATVAVPFVLMMMLAMIVILGASPTLSAVAEDKLQRVFEMLLGTATPFELMAGKVLAAIGQSLTSSVFYIIGGLLALYGMAMFGFAPLGLLPWFLVYLVADVTMLCAMGMALGSACGSAQDAQHLAILLLSPIVVPLFLLTPVIQQPNGPMATVLSLFPLFTPMLMMLRQSLPGGVPAWQPWVGLAGVVIVTPLITWAAARIFRVAILFQGQRPNVAQLLRWAVRG